MHTSIARFTALLLLLVVALTGCGANTTTTQTDGASSPAASGGAASGQTVTLKIGASPVPHAEILKFVQDNLAANAGLNLEIEEFTDYVQPNVALNDKQIDANFFQHVPYMEDQATQRGIDMVAMTSVHIEPLGIYSSKLKSLQEVGDQAVVAIPNDATNGGRALQLLATNGLLTLKEGVGTNATVQDVTDNPKQLQIEELEAAQLPRSLEDADIAVINMNYALEANLKPNTDALALEAGKDNPYANVLAVLRDRQNDPNIQKLAQLLNSPEVKQFIEGKYQGAVLPAF
ncbi:MAG: MetQ/NlpA family ABC transporter substrate-binding protein [Chloroflexi bacterium]|nr:MetQ/NlpA family ABC transporter substrate-binding protein [Chloroflexota bacterium]